MRPRPEHIERFSVDRAGNLVRSVVPKRGKPYEHRCRKESFEEVAYTADEMAAEGAPIKLDDLARRTDTLRNHFADTPISIVWAGAMKKGTMIKESYDGDITCYFNHNNNGGGETLAAIYDNVAGCLIQDYNVERKASAIRVREKSMEKWDLHVDVVPGRYTSDEKSDVNLHRTIGDKRSLKTNLQVHIDHIRGSGVVDAIRLMKLWNVRNAVGAKTFVLELLVVKLLANKKGSTISNQLCHVLTELRDKADNLCVEDPANPQGNDLKPALDNCRFSLQQIARSTLWQIDNSGWDAVFGKVEEKESDSDVTEELMTAASSVKTQTRPWTGD